VTSVSNAKRSRCDVNRVSFQEDQVGRAILAACDTIAPYGISILVSDVIRGVSIRNSELVTEG